MDIKQGEQKFFIGDNEAEPIAEITYKPKDAQTIIVDHTYVSEELRGQGIAGKLVEVIVNFARDEDLKIVPLCPYVKTKMENTEAYHNFIA